MASDEQLEQVFGEAVADNGPSAAATALALAAATAATRHTTPAAQNSASEKQQLNARGFDKIVEGQNGRSDDGNRSAGRPWHANNPRRKSLGS